MPQATELVARGPITQGLLRGGDFFMQRLLTRRLALAGISAVAAFVLVIGGMVIGLHNAHPAQAATHFGPKMRALMRTANHPLAGPHGPLLNHGDSGDDQTSISPTLSALCQS